MLTFVNMYGIINYEKSTKLGDKMESKYYDGTKLLSLKDIDGEKPEIYICTTNRTGGKTTYFSRLCINRFLDMDGKFMLIYRFNYELDNVAEKFFKDVGELFFKGYEMTSTSRARGIYHELFMYPKGSDASQYKSCGYAVALNNADAIKKMSHMFSDTNRMLFDEFQSETNHYCPNEVAKFQSLHTSVARGQGKQTRYVPVYMISNPVTMLNPYYVELGISSRLDNKTKFLRGKGFVLEQGYVDSAAKAQADSGFNRAFANSDYSDYSQNGKYLNDNYNFIEKPKGYSRYLCTIKFKNTEFGIREYPDLGIIYCDDRPDTTFKDKIAVTTDDHNVNYVMLKSNQMFLSSMRYYFDKGCFRFKDLRSKEAIIKMLSY